MRRLPDDSLAVRHPRLVAVLAGCWLLLVALGAVQLALGTFTGWWLLVPGSQVVLGLALSVGYGLAWRRARRQRREQRP
ncbi:hypothetical protein [Kineococcus sp. SYSU DK004]|uniref:hypothetical protein n=1 Tax=Kineococcus sp. SYSU DK004 TaxID=3383125 RepID=UPI003D7CE177